MTKAAYSSYVTRARLSETAVQLGQWARQFHMWSQINGRYTYILDE